LLAQASMTCWTHLDPRSQKCKESKPSKSIHHPKALAFHEFSRWHHPFPITVVQFVQSFYHEFVPNPWRWRALLPMAVEPVKTTFRTCRNSRITNDNQYRKSTKIRYDSFSESL
jgi:hypothetical protein